MNKIIYISIAMFFFFVEKNHAAEPNINKIEYFFDTDPGFGNGTNVTGFSTGQDIANFTFPVDLTSVSEGLHYLYVRSRDEQGRWSETAARVIYKTGAITNTVPNINKIEYYFDTDPGFGNGTNVTGFSSGQNVANFAFPVDVASLTGGLHYLYVRSRDAQGRWSETANRLIYKNTIVANTPEPNINKIEYFIDNDPGFGAANNVTGFTAGQDISNLTFPIDVSAVSGGLHYLSIRSRDAQGRWSETANRLFYKNTNATALMPDINVIEYFFNTDPGYGNGTLIYPPAGQNIANYSFPVCVANANIGANKLYIRSRDAQGRWSETSVSSITVPSGTVPPSVAISGNSTICQGQTATLSVAFSNGVAPYNFTYSDGTNNVAVTTSNNPHLINVSPTVSKIYTIVSSSGQGCAVTASGQGTVTVNPTPNLTISPIAVCQGTPVNLTTLVTDANNTTGTTNYYPTLQDAQNQTNTLSNTTVSPNITSNYFVRKTTNTTCFDIKTITITINTSAIVNAGMDQTLCTNGLTNINLVANIGGSASSITWSGGNGTFANVNNLSTTYTPTAAELNTASIILTATTDDPPGSCTAAMDNLTIFFNKTTGGSISSNQTVCSGITPNILQNSSTPTGSNLVYQWQSSTTDCNSGFSDILNANALTYAPSAISVTTFFRRKTTSTINSVSCESFSNCVTLQLAAPLSMTTVVNTPFLCNGLSNTGSVTLNPTSGVSPYTYQYCTGNACTNFGSTQSIGTFNNLPKGNYTFKVTDNQGCTTTSMASIQGVEVAFVSSQNLTCYANNSGKMTFAASGGTSPYNYNLQFGAQNTTGVFANLAAGTYRVTVTDNAGCVGVSSFNSISQPSALTLSGLVTNLVDCLNTNSGAVALLASGGTMPFEYKIGSNAYQTSASFANLTASAHTFTVKDAQGCTTPKDITVDAYKIEIIGQNGVCNGNSTSLTTIKNTSLLSQQVWSTAATTPSISITPSSSTIYSVTATNPSNGCTAIASKNVDVYSNPTVAITNFIPITCANLSTAQATATASNGQPPYTYTWSGGVPNGAVVTGLNIGNYSVTATDAHTCKGVNNSINVVPYINPATISFSTLPTLTTTFFTPSQGAPEDRFRFAIKFTHPDNKKPKSGYPRLLLDYEGNGVYTDVFDRAAFMQPSNFNDNTTTDGKIYATEVYGMVNSTNWKAKIIVIDENDCLTEVGPFDGPDVLIAPNVYVFADDISFTPKNPSPGDSITVKVKIHNNSDFDVNNIVAHLHNEYNGVAQPDLTGINIMANSFKTVEWRMVAPSIPSFNPMHIDIDWLNTIAEGNELDNHAVRPFTAGQYNLPGGINVSVTAKPDTVCLEAILNDIEDKVRINVTGSANYYGLAVPLADPSVAGADVAFSILETGQQFSGFSSSNGSIAFSFKPPAAIGTYNIQGEITDYTLEKTFSTYFVVAGCPSFVPPPLPELAGVFTANAPYGDFDDDGKYEYLVVQGNALNSSLKIMNNNEFVPTGQSFHAKHFTLTGNITQQDYTVPALAPLGSHTINLPAITFNTLGINYLHGFTDSQFEVVEYGEDNNWTNIRIKVVPAQTDIELQDVIVSPMVTNACTPTNINVRIKNKGNQNTGNFEVELIVKNGAGTIVKTEVKTVSSLAYYQTGSAIFGHQFTTNGTYTFEVKCDYLNAIVEANENNNNNSINRFIFVAPCKPNLQFENPLANDYPKIYCDTKVIDPNVPQIPGMLDLGQMLYNVGQAPITNPQVKMIITGTPPIEITWTHNGTIPAGGSAFVHQNIPTPSFGNRTLEFVADPNNNVDESEETDNGTIQDALCWEFNFGQSGCGAGRPCPSGVSGCKLMWFDTAYVNVPVKPYFGILNNGKYFGANVKLKFEVKGPGIPNWTDLGNAVTNTIHTCETCPIMVELPTPFSFPQVGNYEMRFTIDPNNEYEECNENNNVEIINFNVSNKPDMFVRSSRIDLEKIHPAVNQNVQWVRVTYENLGANNVQDTMELKLLIDGLPVDSLRVPGLIHGGFSTKQFNVNWSSPLPGIHVVRAIIDNDKEVVETNEMNNEATRAIVVGDAPDLIFSYFNVNNLNPSIGQTIQADFKIKNNGDFDCTSSLKFFYKNDNNIEIPIDDKAIFVKKRDSIYVTMFWTVVDPNTVLIARMVNSNPIEARTDNNEAQQALNGVSAAVATVQVNCNPNSGKANAIVTGGQAPYTFAWSNGSTAQNATGFAVGSYSLTVSDSNGGSNSVSFNMTAQTPVDISVNVLQNITCFGYTNGRIQVSGKDGTAPYSYLWSTGGQLPYIDNLGVGTYTVTVTDFNNCKKIRTFIMDNPPLMTATATHTDVTCTGGTNGSVVVTATGGAPPYNYQWTNAVSTSNTANNLAFGLWNCSITDSKNCYTTTGAIVLEPTPITLTINNVGVGCNGNTMGSFSVSVSGGTPHPTNGYTFQYGTFIQTGTTFGLSNLSTGTYNFVISDNNNCSKAGTVTIGSCGILAITTTGSLLNCSAGTDGTASVLASGGSGNYAYLWSTGATTASISGLFAGNYTVTVTDNGNNQVKIGTATVTQPTALSLTSTNDAVICHGDTDGTVSVSVNGGTAPYSYVWSISSAPNIPQLNSVGVGTYTVTVTDSKGCTIIGAASVSQPTQLVALAANDNVLCFGDNDGTIIANATGGTPSYQYRLGAIGASSTNKTFSNLSVGTYTIFTQDSHGCQASINATVSSPPQITVASIGDQVVCPGDADGTITVNATGGTQPYLYTIGTKIQTSKVFPNLSNGTYTIYVEDNNGCSGIGTATITTLSPILDATVSNTQVACFGQNNGVLTTIATGGTPPLSYKIGNTTNATGIFNNLSANAYVVKIEDDYGCLITKNKSVASNPQLTATAISDQVVCPSDADATVTVYPIGGTAPYSFKYNSSPSQNNPYLSNLPVGTYNITVTDSKNCKANTSTSVTSYSPPMNLTVTAINSCTGTPNTGALASVTGGIAPYTYLWNNNATTTQLCNLPSGNYTVTVTDDYGCSVNNAYVQSFAANNTKENTIKLEWKPIDENEILAYPNPLSTELNIRFFGKKESVYEVDIYNSLGQIVFSQHGLKQDKGQNTMLIQTLEWSDGTYFVLFKTLDKTKIIPVVKASF
jgi:CARDB/SprB repeat/Secretion system C-terminal sorting domain